MATKKKSTTGRFIAIDNSEGVVIEIGTYPDVREAIEEYVNDRNMDEGDVECYIEVFTIGEKRAVNASVRGLEIDFL